METLTNNLRSFVSDPAAGVAAFKDHGRHVLDLIREHPWTSVGVAAGTALVWSYVRAPRNLPPGPIGVPFIGALDSFAEDMPEKMLALQPKYGEVISFYRFGQLNIILNSERTIKEAFVKQADDFSHREPLMVYGIGLIDDLFAGEYGDHWKKQKKFALSSLKSHGFGTAKSESRILEQLNFMNDFLIKSNGSAVDIAENLTLFNAGVILRIVIGGDPSQDDPDVKQFINYTHEWFKATGDLFLTYKMLLVLIFPGLIKPFSKPAHANAKNLADFLCEKIEKNAADIASREVECVADAYLKEYGTSPEAIRNVAITVIAFMLDAIETAAMVDRWLILFIAKYPEVQEKLQKEVDSVVGSSRLPSLSDRADMPYTQAVIHETLRLGRIIPMTLNRLLNKNIKFDGFTLPKGAHVAANIQAVHLDPKIFPEPEKFNPSRFIGSDGKFNSTLAGRILTFSIGSRKCLGEAYFKVQVFFFLTRLMQQFNVEFNPDAPAPDIGGKLSFFELDATKIKLCFKAR